MHDFTTAQNARLDREIYERDVRTARILVLQDILKELDEEIADLQRDQVMYRNKLVELLQGTRSHV